MELVSVWIDGTCRSLGGQLPGRLHVDWGNGGCDGVIEQAALPQKRRVSSLGDIRDQSVQQGAQPPDDLVLPGAEGPDLVEGELDEILPLGAGYTNRTAPWRSVTIPVDKCFAAA